MAPSYRTSKQPTKPTKPTKSIKTTRRPLNAFIGYRKYYSTIFMLLPGSQQKYASSLLTYMWQFEPGKGAWTALARAWSIVRDFQGKECSPLGAFIELNADLLKIVSPSEYLVVMGFGIVYDAEDQPTLQHLSEPTQRPVEAHASSVEEILRNSIAAGYVDGNVLSKLDQNILLVQPQAAGNTTTDKEIERNDAGAASVFQTDDQLLPGQPDTTYHADLGLSPKTREAILDSMIADVENPNTWATEYTVDRWDKTMGSASHADSFFTPGFNWDILNTGQNVSQSPIVQSLQDPCQWDSTNLAFADPPDDIMNWRPEDCLDSAL